MVWLFFIISFVCVGGGGGGDGMTGMNRVIIGTSEPHSRAHMWSLEMASSSHLLPLGVNWNICLVSVPPSKHQHLQVLKESLASCYFNWFSY